MIYIIYTLRSAEDRYKENFVRAGSSASVADAAQKDCPEKLVLQVNSGGGLGNVMMDYATVYVAARELSRGHIGMADGNHQFLYQFFTHIEMENISTECKSAKKDFIGQLDTLSGSRFKELYYSGLANPTNVAEFSNTHDNVIFSTYDWLPILFPKYLSELKYVFEFREPILDKTEATFEQVKRSYLGVDKPLLFIGIHIRRIDYEYHLKILYNISLVDEGFFLTARDYFQNKYSKNYTLVYLAVSNDVPWVEDKLKFPNLHVVSQDAPTDMALLSQCNHTITDYGTFGFLPSLLHGGEHYTTNVYEDFIVAMMYQMKGWTVINITTPLDTSVANNHPRGWLTTLLQRTETTLLPDNSVYLTSTF